jgi:hypothetical protein
MFGKKPQATPRQLTAVTIPPEEYSQSYSEDKSEEDSYTEEEQPAEAVVTPKQPQVQPRAKIPVSTQQPVQEKVEVKEEPKGYAYIIASEMIEDGTFNYVIRSNLLLRPGRISITELNN